MEAIALGRELEEIIKCMIDSADVGGDMLRYPLLNTLKTLHQKLQEGDTEFLTPSFIKSLKRAREILPYKERELKLILDNILKMVS